MKTKIILFLFAMVLLIGLVFSAEETISKTIDIGNLIGEGLDITANGVEFIKKENENTLINFLEGGSASINGSLFMNVKESSSIELDNTGRIVFADLTATEKTIFTLGGTDYEIPKGGRIKYEEGKPAVFYGKAGDSLRFKNKLFDESGNDIGKFSNLKLNGESIKIERIGENSIIEGNFEIGNDKIKGFGENAGKITLSKDGKISEIWKNTDATVGNMNHKVSGNNLKMYYDDNFNPLEHKNENYFNYGKGKISAGGIGFSSDLGKINNIFGDMNTTKFVQGIGTKERNLGFTLNGGNLEIDTKNPNLGFNIKSEGDFVIKNGRAVIYSEKGYVIKDGKASLSDENSFFVKADYKDGLSYSYDLNFNDGEYELEDNFFKDKNGNVLVNTNLPWENEVYLARHISLSEAGKVRSEMEKEWKMIYVDNPNFLTWIQGEGGEAIMKETYLATERANQNKYDVKISPLELYAAMKSEGAGFMPEDSSRKALYKKFLEDPNWGVVGMETGLTYVGGPQEIKNYMEGGFIPEDLKVKSMGVGKDKNGNIIYTPGLTAKDAFTYFAGVLAHKKYLFLEDYKKLYPGRELTSDEESYWTRYYFNAGEGNGLTALKDIDQNYVAVWEGGRPKETPKGNPKFNARIANDFMAYVKIGLGLFNYPS